MSLKLGSTNIAGLSERLKYNAHHMFDFKWSDCMMNDMSWLRADTFSWQSGAVYVAAYNHLVQDLQGRSSETETIGSTTITFYRASDGHKIVSPNMESAVVSIYNETGIAWYYIVDTTNERFKLPRTKFGFEGFRNSVGNVIGESLPNITGQHYEMTTKPGEVYYSGAFYQSGTGTSDYRAHNSDSGSYPIINFDASRSSSAYQDGAPVQERATQMYLYFYVGDFNQTATEQTAGLNSSLFNSKLDIPQGRSQSSSGLLVEDYSNGASWYRVYSDGWCEQGSTQYANVSITVNLLKPYIDTNYTVIATCDNNGSGNVYHYVVYYDKTASSVCFAPLYGATLYPGYVSWFTCGYIS